MKDKVTEIINTLIQSTENGDLIWTEQNPASNRRSYLREMSAIGEDGSKFEIEIKYNLFNEEWVLEREPAVWIKNADLPGGMYYINGGKFNTAALRDTIKEKHCADMNPKIEDIESMLDGICKKISVSTYRDSKINKIL